MAKRGMVPSGEGRKALASLSTWPRASQPPKVRVVRVTDRGSIVLDINWSTQLDSIATSTGDWAGRGRTAA